MRYRSKLAASAGIECPKDQSNRRFIVDRSQSASARRAEGSRRPLAGSPCGRRAARAIPHDCLARELDPRQRQSARVALTYRARASMRFAGNTGYREPDTATDATTRIALERLHVLVRGKCSE